MEKDFPNDKNGLIITNKIVKEIKRYYGNKEFNCICGISGGRDSMFTIYYLKRVLKLNPIAVHFNDGFGNPIAGENMVKGCDILNVKLITITSDWRESKDIRKAFKSKHTRSWNRNRHWNCICYTALQSKKILNMYLSGNPLELKGLLHCFGIILTVNMLSMFSKSLEPKK